MTALRQSPKACDVRHTRGLLQTAPLHFDRSWSPADQEIETTRKLLVVPA